MRPNIQGLNIYWCDYGTPGGVDIDRSLTDFRKHESTYFKKIKNKIEMTLSG